MNVLHVSVSDGRGGAHRAAYRIHRAVLQAGLDSKMLVRRKLTSDDTVQAISGLRERLFVRIRRSLSKPLLALQESGYRGTRSLNIFPTGLHHRINDSDADIVNLHWVNEEMISIREIARIRKPIVWSLHDEWPYSSTVHYGQSGEDPVRLERHKTVYARANRQFIDIDAYVSHLKRKHWSRRKISFVASTSWLANRAARSAVCDGFDVHVIPLPLDTRVFKPVEQAVARSVLNLPPDKSLVLFGAGRLDDPRKGYDLLVEALTILRGEQGGEVHAVVFGADGRAASQMPLPIHHLGVLKDDASLVLAYSSADVVVVPSRLEAFGQTASEAMACGTPVVAFRGTGVADVVDHGKNGYLAQPYEPSDLARMIALVLDESADRLSKDARRKAETAYGVQAVASRYSQLYEATAEISNTVED